MTNPFPVEGVELTILRVVTGGDPTPNKPTVTFASPADLETVSHELTLRVPDCWAAYETLRSRGAEFLTPPVESGWETRAFFRDPDGHLPEISSVKAGWPEGVSRRPAGEASTRRLHRKQSNERSCASRYWAVLGR